MDKSYFIDEKTVVSKDNVLFKISDIVTIKDNKSPNYGKLLTILGFRWNKSETEICAITNIHTTSGIGVDKICRITDNEYAPKRISFYVKYTEEFTEDLYNALWEWSKKNSKFPPRGYADSYEGLKIHKFYIFDNWTLDPRNKYGGIFSDKRSYGVDNNEQLCEEEYSIEQVKKLIGYKEPSVEFIPGKWYKYNRWYIKYKEHIDNVWRSSEQINSYKKYSQNEGSFGDRDSDDKKILLIDLSEIQEYLPEGHPDKIGSFNFEVGKWYNFTTMKGKYNLYVKVASVTDRNLFFMNRESISDGYLEEADCIDVKLIENPRLVEDLSEIQDFLPEGHVDKFCETCNGEGETMVGKLYPSGHIEVTDTCPDCNGTGFINNVDKIQLEEFKKGEYIVITDNYSGGFCTNYIYKQRKDYIYLESELDNNGSRTNGFSRYEKKNPHNWRYATEKESIEYERRGEPYNVNELTKTTVFSEINRKELDTDGQVTFLPQLKNNKYKKMLTIDSIHSVDTQLKIKKKTVKF